MKKKQTTKVAAPEKPANETPKYHLADVPQHLRARLLDLCFRRLYHDAMKLLEVHGFNNYTQDDLVNFYHWAPSTLPGQTANQLEPPRTAPRDYDRPPPEQIEDIRRRLAQVPADVLDRIHKALKHDSIDVAGSLLWKAGAGFTSAELYEYRKTLFPPNSLVDAYTSGPPALRNPSDGSVDSLSASSAIDNSAPTSDHEPVTMSTSLPSIPLLPPGEGRGEGLPLASDLRPPTSGLILLFDLRNIIRRYVVLPDMAAETLALWVVHTYAFTLREVTTYIAVVSPEKRCGKTTLLELLRLLSHEAIAAANISSSALFRVIEEKQPTLIIDEADTFLQRRDEMAGILNAGYRKSNAYVVRVENKPRRKSSDPTIHSSINPPIHQSGGAGLAQYSCWCLKVMAAIGRLPDTLADRCIVITMQRKMPGEQCERMRRLNAAELGKRCADFVGEHNQAIAAAQPDIPVSLNDRAADIWEPLFAIADLAGGDWPARAREAAEKLSGSQDDEVTLVGYFLRDIRTLIYSRDSDRILSRDIVAALNPRHDRPWEDLRRGREINEWWLGRKMSELGIRSKLMRIGRSVGKGYTLADVTAAYQRYVPNQEPQEAEGNG